MVMGLKGFTIVKIQITMKIEKPKLHIASCSFEKN